MLSRQNQQYAKTFQSKCAPSATLFTRVSKKLSIQRVESIALTSDSVAAQAASDSPEAGVLRCCLQAGDARVPALTIAPKKCPDSQSLAD